jgi:CRISPR-associated protein Csm3
MSFDLIFQGKFFISGVIQCKTGLHIGGSDEGFEIGGNDNPVIRNPINGWPYIPGSSLKGKLRHLTEWSLGKNEFTKQSLAVHFTVSDSGGKPSFKPCSCGQCSACVLFGVTPDDGVKENVPAENSLAVLFVSKPNNVEEEAEGKTYLITGPTRLTVRDAFPSKTTRDEWQKFLGDNIYTELKTENALDRVTAEANPRSLERVTAGSEFEFEMIVDLYRPRDKELLQALFSAMALLEDSALGGSGSRGSGRIAFDKLNVEYRPVAYYRDGAEARVVNLGEAKTVREILKQFGSIDWGV